ncbi:MAG TPA: hypothetical protein VH391_07745 [Solirubrobacterales bacterium]
MGPIEGRGRTPEERRAAAEARARSRRGESPETGDEELLEPAGPRGADDGLERRHYGGGDIYLRRRLIALGVVIVVIVAIFLLVGGC